MAPPKPAEPKAKTQPAQPKADDFVHLSELIEPLPVYADSHQRQEHEQLRAVIIASLESEGKIIVFEDGSTNQTKAEEATPVVDDEEDESESDSDNDDPVVRAQKNAFA